MKCNADVESSSLSSLPCCHLHRCTSLLSGSAGGCLAGYRPAKDTKRLLVHTFTHITHNLQTSRNTISPTVINNSQLQHISVSPSENSVIMGPNRLYTAFLFQCTMITSSNKRINPNGDAATCVEQSVEIQIYLKKQAKNPKM